MTILDFHGYAIDPKKLVYFHRDKQGPPYRHGLRILFDTAFTLFVPESKDAPAYDEAKALYAELLKLLRDIGLVYFRGVWFSPSHVVRLRTGPRLESIDDKEKKPTIELMFTPGPWFWAFDRQEEMEKELGRLLGILGVQASD